MDPLLRAARAALASAALLWAVLVLTAPSLGRVPHTVPLHVAAGTYLVGAAVCHQRPERSFHVAGVRLPVCGRCTGLYLSGALGVLAGLAWAGLRRARGTREPAVDWRGWLLAAAVPTVATLAGEWAGWWVPSNAARAIAAVPLGAVAGVLVAAGLSFRGRL
jgi:uncharacterized membrane protein